MDTKPTAPMSNEKDGIEVTVYRIAKGFLYLAGNDGKKYKTPNILGEMAHVGLRLRNVKFKSR